MIPTVPVARGCPRCGGWFTRDTSYNERPPTPLYTCALCGEEIRIEGGIPVSAAYEPTALERRDLGRAPHTGPHASPTEITRQLAGGVRTRRRQP